MTRLLILVTTSSIMMIQPTQFCDCLLRFSIVARPKSAEEKKRVIIEADTVDERNNMLVHWIWWVSPS